MVIPIDAEKDKAQHIAQEFWSQRHQRRQSCLMGNLEFQYHDRNDNGKYTIAKGFESAFGHSLSCKKGPCHQLYFNREQAELDIVYSQSDHSLELETCFFQ